MADSEEVIDEYDLTDSSGEDNALNLVPLATFGNGKTSTPGIISSAVADSSAPWAEDGVLHIPAGMIINDVQAGDSWSISNGIITVARANGTTEGVIGSISIESTTSKVPVISQGSIIIPLAQAVEGELSTSIHTPGAISGIEYTEGACLGIVDGVVRIPKPKYYTFDSDWFTVDGDTVSLRQDALESVINELTDEMSVEVTGSGILEETYAGTLKANTSGSLTLNTNVTY